MYIDKRVVKININSLGDLVKGQVCFLSRSFSSTQRPELLKGGAARQGHVAAPAVIDRQITAQPAVALL